ncbi:MAG: 30S ribosomal protein S16 [Actinomycetes bacterium]
MAVKIRLKRMGKIRAPYYRVVVVDSRKKRDGRVIEEIGLYHPKEEPSLIEVTSERAQYWLGVGAQPTEAVEAILKVTGDWQKFKGLPGAEGTLRTAEPKRDKAEIFNEALKESKHSADAEAVTAKAPKKAPADASETPEAPAEKDVVGGQSPESAVESAEKAETQALDAERQNREAEGKTGQSETGGA